MRGRRAGGERKAVQKLRTRASPSPPHASFIPPLPVTRADLALGTRHARALPTGLVVGRGRAGSVGRVGGVGGRVAQVVAALGGVGHAVEAAGVVLVGTHVRVGRTPTATAAAARRVLLLLLLVGVVAAVGSGGHGQGGRLLRLVEAAAAVAATRASAAAARGLWVLVVRAGGRDLGRVHVGHQTVKDSSHPGREGRKDPG